MTIEYEEIREPQPLYPEDVRMYDRVLCRVMSILFDRPASIPPEETLALTGALHRLREHLAALNTESRTSAGPLDLTCSVHETLQEH